MLFNDAKPPLSELAHFGVKGMRWGVRRDEGYSSTESRDARKEARKNLQKVTENFIDRKYSEGLFDRVITAEQYKKLSTKEVVVRKGRVVRRVTSSKDDRLGDQTFVSYTKRDQNTYRAVMPAVNSTFALGGRKNYKPSYEATYKSLGTLRSPSEKARVDAFIDLMDSKEIHLRANKVISGRDYLRKNGYGREARTLDRQQLGLKFYKDFTEGQGNHKDAINQAYFKKLRDKGYNSIVDDNDRYNLSEAPLIVLNPNGTLKRMGVKRLTADEVNQAQRDLELPD